MTQRATAQLAILQALAFWVAEQICLHKIYLATIRATTAMVYRTHILARTTHKNRLTTFQCPQDDR